jgi:hypothetical protein
VQFGEPDVADIIPESPTVSVLVRGQLVVTRFDATVRKRNGKCFLQEVKPYALLHAARLKDSIVRQINAQAIYAKQIGAIYEQRTEIEIYSYPLLVENKQRMRQILVMYLDENLNQEITYLTSLLRVEPTIRINELNLKCGSDSIGRQKLEAAAYRMHIDGQLSINLKEARYGSADSVASCGHL